MSGGAENRVGVAVKGFIVHGGRVLLLRRAAADAIDPGVWEGVGGKLEFGETLEDALAREVREEAGLSVTVERLLYAAEFKPNAHRQVVLLAYLCRAEETAVTLSEEHQAFLWADRAQACALLPESIRSDLDRSGAWSLLFGEAQ